MSAQTAELMHRPIMDVPNAASILSFGGISITNIIELNAYGISTNVL